MNKTSVTIDKTATMDFSSVKKIAVFRALQLGDILCSIPALRAVRAAFPEARVCWIGLPWQRDLASRFSSYIDEFIPFPGWPGLPEQEFDPQQAIRFLEEMQSRRFDLVLQMQGNGTFVNAMCMLFGAKELVGFRREDESLLSRDRSLVLNENEHEIIRFIRLLESIGIKAISTDLEFPVYPQEVRRAEDILQHLDIQKHRYVCLHPGARDSRRRMPAELFSAVGDFLSEKGCQVLLTGSAGEAEVLAAVASRMKTPPANLVDSYGHVGIGELAALIELSAGIVCNDTGVSHIASARMKPSIVLFSEHSDPQRWAPLNSVLHVAVRPPLSSQAEYVNKAVASHFKLNQQAKAIFPAATVPLW